MSARFQWYGAEVRARALARTAVAIDTTLEATRRQIEDDHWWQERNSEGLISRARVQGAHYEHGLLVGRVGTSRYGGFYGLFLERQHPFIRAAADRTFPSFFAQLSAL